MVLVTVDALSTTNVMTQLARSLERFAALGGDDDMPAFHDLEDDVVIYKWGSDWFTAGDVRKAREALFLWRSYNIALGFNADGTDRD